MLRTNSIVARLAAMTLRQQPLFRGLAVPAREMARATGQTEPEWYQGRIENADISLEIPKWIQNAKKAASRLEELPGNWEAAPCTIDSVVATLTGHAAQDLAVLDLRAFCDHLDYMVIVTGNSAKQVYSLADSIRKLAKNSNVKQRPYKATLAVEGRECDDWMVVDLGDIIVHSFSPERRAEFDLEALWQDVANEKNMSMEA